MHLPLSKAASDGTGGFKPPRANQIICSIDTINTSLISVLSGLYGWSLIQVNCSHCQLFLWRVLQLRKSGSEPRCSLGAPRLQCVFSFPQRVLPLSLHGSLCAHHYNNRIHKTKHRNKGITYWQLMKHRKIVQVLRMQKVF